MDPKNPVAQDPVASDQGTNPPSPIPQPVSPISGGNKEHGPIGGGQVSEYVSVHPSEAAPEIPPEVAEHVEQAPNTEQPEVSEEVKQAGVSQAKESVPVTVSDAPVAPVPVQLPTPMNYEEAKKEVSQGNPNNSKTWLGMLSKYVLEKFGMQKTV